MDLWMIGVIFGATGVATFVLELPLGAVADIHGRIKIFRISVAVQIVAFLLAVFSTEFWHLIVVAALIGLSSALRSGSVNAWVVERINENGMGETLQSYLGTFQASMAAGMAAGAIGGGYIPAYMPHSDQLTPTSWNLLLIVGLGTFHLLISPYLFSEGEQIAPPEEHASLKGQMKTASEALNISAKVQVKVLPILLAVVLYILVTRANFGPLIATYLAFMLVLSMIGPPSEALLNNEVTDNIRSTMQKYPVSPCRLVVLYQPSGLPISSGF